ncbi:hypothetical protein PSE10B_02320 [Pseudomonas amygdali pv. eriobotryae]|nr:hypothetical protein PSE10B_02320 [Pseudomonas amygdali pv. eriobotryae]
MIYSADIQKLEPGNQIRLYELDATRLGATLSAQSAAFQWACRLRQAQCS